MKSKTVFIYLDEGYPVKVLPNRFKGCKPYIPQSEVARAINSLLGCEVTVIGDTAKLDAKQAVGMLRQAGFNVRFRNGRFVS